MADQEEPDLTQDPREKGTGQGYPESQQEEATPREGTDRGPAAGTDADQPDRGSTKDADREASTGNPGAAGA